MKIRKLPIAKAPIFFLSKSLSHIRNFLFQEYNFLLNLVRDYTANKEKNNTMMQSDLLNF